MNLLGEWQEDRHYIPGDAVTYQGSLYMPYREVFRGVPPSERDSGWQVYVSKGDKPEKCVDYFTEQDIDLFKGYIVDEILNGEW